MSVMEIVHYGDPILRKKCNPVKNFSRLDSLLNDIFETMYEADGIGLAANQVGLDMNLFVIDVTHTEEAEKPYVFINGEIITKIGEKMLYQEGCLSIPGIAVEISRPEKIILKYQTQDENWHEEEFDGLLSRAIQHEIDHLNGIFIVDYLSKVEKMKYTDELNALVENTQKNHIEKSNHKGFVL